MNLPAVHDDRVIAPGRLRRGLRCSIAASSVGMVWMAIALNMPFTMLMEALGASGVVLGITTTVRQLAILAQIPGSLLMERLPRRKAAWMTLALVHRACWLAPAWLAWHQPRDARTVGLIVLAISVSSLFENLATPGWHSWIADLLPAAMRGRFWGKRQSVVTAIFLTTIGVSGWLLDRFADGPAGSLNGFAWLLGIAALFGMADILMHAFVPEPARRPALPGRRWFVRIMAPLRHPSFRNLAIGIGIWLFACTMSGTFTVVYLKRVFQVSYTELSALTICGALSTVVGSLFMGYLIERIGARALAVTMMGVAPLFGFAWFFVTAAPVEIVVPYCGVARTSQALLLMSVVSLFSGGLYGAVGVCHLSLLGALAPRRERTLAMAVHLCLIGLLTAAGPLTGGWIVDLFARRPAPIMLFGGTRFDYMQMLGTLHAIVIWTLAVPFMMRVRARREPLNIGEAFGRVILVNPLRLASGVYHAHMLAVPAPRHRRRRAAEALGAAGVEIAVADLIQKLDDPVADVREAAALALGRIGTPAAHDGLLARIADPDNDLTLTALRALRFVPDRRLTPRLLPLLEGEALVVREVVRTLGACGDAAAVAPLLALLHRTPQGPLVAITAETLGHFGDISAVYEVLPRFRTAVTPFMRRALAAACGDLLGQPDRFYELLTREEQSAGAGVARALRGARRVLWRPRRRLTARWRRALRALLAQLERACENDSLPAAAAVAGAVSRCLAEARHGVTWEGDIGAFLRALDRRDARFTVGAWYLAILEGEFAKLDASGSLAAVRDRLEILLAVHLVASWIDAADRPAGPPPPGALSLTSFWPPAGGASS